MVVRNEEKYLENLLEAILNQDFPHDRYEIIVVDGDSKDRSPEIIESFRKRHRDRIRVYNNPKKTLATGWNLGIQNANGEYVIRVDGHSRIPRDFLSSTYRVIQRVPAASCVGGLVETVGTGFWGEVNAYVYSHPFGVGNSKFRTTKSEWEGYVDTVPYAAYKREIFDQVGYFDETLKRNEDLEMHARIRNQGGTFFLSTMIRSTYYVRNTLAGLIKKSFSDGKWTMVASRRGAGVLRWRHLIPFVAVLVGLILSIGAFFSPLAGYTLLTLFGAYLTLLVISSFGIVGKKGWSYLIPCMLTFILLHASRGLGSAASLFSKHYWSNAAMTQEEPLKKKLPTLPFDTKKILELRTRCQKSRREEEIWSWYVLRRISIYVTLLLRKTPVTPNGVTWFSLIMFGLTGWLMLWAEPWALLLAVVTYNLGYLGDCVDGELARLTGVKSRQGVFLDTLIRAISIPILVAFALGAHTLNGAEPLNLWIATGIYLTTLAATLGLAIPLAFNLLRLENESDPVGEMRKSSMVWEWVAFLTGMPGFFALLPVSLILDTLSAFSWTGWFITVFLVLWAVKTAMRLYLTVKKLKSDDLHVRLM